MMFLNPLMVGLTVTPRHHDWQCQGSEPPLPESQISVASGSLPVTSTSHGLRLTLSCGLDPVDFKT